MHANVVRSEKAANKVKTTLDLIDSDGQVKCSFLMNGIQPLPICVGSKTEDRYLFPGAE